LFKSQSKDLTGYLKGSGIEIGALNNPLEVKDAKVLYVDYLEHEALIKSNPETRDAEIRKPDINADAEDLSVIESGSQDFVILSHVLEHLPNPLKALKEIHRVLRNGGIFYLSVPDKRFSFDNLREVTPLLHIVDDFKSGMTPGKCLLHYEEWLNLVELKKEKPVAKTVDELIKGGYRIHYHVFLPETLLQLLTYAGENLGVSFLLKDHYYNKGDLNIVLILEKQEVYCGLPVILKEKPSKFNRVLGRFLKKSEGIFNYAKISEKK